MKCKNLQGRRETFSLKRVIDVGLLSAAIMLYTPHLPDTVSTALENRDVLTVCEMQEVNSEKMSCVFKKQ